MKIKNFQKAETSCKLVFSWHICCLFSS